MSPEESIPTSREPATTFYGGEDIAFHAASEKLMSYEELARQRVGEALAATLTTMPCGRGDERLSDAAKTRPSGSAELSQVQTEKEPLKPWDEMHLITGALIKIRTAYHDSHIDLTKEDVAV